MVLIGYLGESLHRFIFLLHRGPHRKMPIWLNFHGWRGA